MTAHVALAAIIYTASVFSLIAGIGLLPFYDRPLRPLKLCAPVLLLALSIAGIIWVAAAPHGMATQINPGWRGNCGK